MSTKPRYFLEAGQRFGRGVVIDPDIRTGFTRSTPNGVRGARLRCDCGNIYDVRLTALRPFTDRAGATGTRSTLAHADACTTKTPGNREKW